MKEDPIIYLARAIKRIESGAVESDSGSHVEGIFIRVAGDFEKVVRSYLVRLLKTCGLNYETEIRSTINGPGFNKLTLGKCIAAIEEASNLRPDRVASLVPGSWKLGDFLQMLGRINDAWIPVKHRDGTGEVEPLIMLAQMKSMLTIYQVLPRRSGNI